ncbi:MAG: hypothetical protein UX44_C0032G0005 [candidate division WWE3 bacterium GW2011_GWA1_46_21]|uniref:Uncharacterized protein n=1 Tax=candidate division WWE3 bacterium GW2011_GWA1_46_21 TaxID=1619107 RepID=A0A0G1S8X4_UNCKA|nr:MAG: hypothetical protein UX44_C0032G0005 [candidate division WWE3 bacterium GW2011_GWA1_46_21]
MFGVLFAAGAEFLHYNFVGCVDLVLFGDVILPFANAALQPEQNPVCFLCHSSGSLSQADGGVKIWDFLEPREGVEPSTSSLPWKRSTTELPRPGAGDRIRTCGGLRQLFYRQLRLATSVPRLTPTLEPTVGLEPTADGLQNRCSTTELRWHAKDGLRVRF